ncbi:hypothetical protein V7166_12015 [Bacillus thuringiensis]
MPSIKSGMSNPQHISLDDVCYLITIKTIEDELGQQEGMEKEQRPVFCSRLNVSRQEFLAGGQLGLKPRVLIVVDADEYDFEEFLVYEDTEYSVYRSFMRSDGLYELYCEVKSGGQSQRLSTGDSEPS